MIKRYLLKLYPTDTFFFGGETTFGTGSRRNYLAHSEDFPQQTTLLGMLRYQLLAQNGQIPIKDRTLAESLIGTESFQPDGTAEFGKVIGLSPVFLMYADLAYRPNPLDFKFYQKDGELQHHQLSSKPVVGRAYLAGRILDTIPSLAGFDHKTDYQEQFIAADTIQTQPKSSVLVPVEQIGIQKSENGKALTNAFFKQTRLRFPTSNWAFACYVDLDAALQSAVVTLGAEQALFRLEVEIVQTTPTDSPADAYLRQFNLSPVKNHQRIELLSDACVDRSLYDHCDLAYTDTVSFRSIRTKVTTATHYHGRPTKSNRLELLRRGSVLWTKNPDETLLALTKTEFQKIGYNMVYNGPVLSNLLTTLTNE